MQAFSPNGRLLYFFEGKGIKKEENELRSIGQCAV
jgi:hypothetical protein